MRLSGERDAGEPAWPGGQRGALPRIRGWLLVYVAALAVFVLHGAELTVASIIIYAHPAVAGLRSFVPLGFLLLYVITNVILILYAAVLFVLMAQRRRPAIVNNVIFNVLSIAFLLMWHFAGEKSNAGTLIDSAPNLAGAAYILLSGRVRSTFVTSRRSGLAREGLSTSGNRARPGIRRIR